MIAELLRGAEEHAEGRRVEQRRLSEVDDDRRGAVARRRTQSLPQLWRPVQIHVPVDDQERDARFRPLFFDPERVPAPGLRGGFEHRFA